MTLGTILLIVFIVLMLASIPAYPYSRQWGYAPFGGLAAIVVVVILLMVLGIIPVTVSHDGGNLNIDLPKVNVTQ